MDTDMAMRTKPRSRILGTRILYIRSAGSPNALVRRAGAPEGNSLKLASGAICLESKSVQRGEVTATKRHLQYGVLALLVVALSRPVIAQDLPALKTLEPAGLFGIPGAPSLTVGRIVSSGKSLWFLLNGPNYSEAVKTNSDGLEWTPRLRQPVNPQHAVR